MIYNYKSEELVQDVILDSCYNLIVDIADEYSTLRRYENLSIYVPSYIAREILGMVLEELEGVWVDEESHTDLLYEDENEVIITIAEDGMLYIETARGESGQLKDNDDCALTYIYDGFSKKDVDYLSKNGESILVFGFEDEDEFHYESEDFECDGCCERCECGKENELIVGSTAPTGSTYFMVNGKEVDAETYGKALEEINARLNSFENMFRRFMRMM